MKRILHVGFAALCLLFLDAGSASAQRFGGGGYRPYTPYTPVRPNYIPGLPNPLSNPWFNWYYRNAPRYWNGSAWMVVPPGVYYGGGYNYGPTAPAPDVSAEPTSATVDLRVTVPTQETLITVNGTPMSGTGINRLLHVHDVQTGAGHAITVSATWMQYGIARTESKTVNLTGPTPYSLTFP